jgi:YggT family protein
MRGSDMMPIIWLINTVVQLFFWIMLAMIIISWLMHFGIIDGRNQYVRQINYFLRRVTEPVLAPIRRLLPDLGGIDISPIVVLIGLEFIRQIVVGQLLKLV